jgi:hypothetical protein
MARGKKKVRCGGCKRLRSHVLMELFGDKEFCDQECHDAFYGIIRDNDGDVISEGERYYIKGAAQCTEPK